MHLSQGQSRGSSVDFRLGWAVSSGGHLQWSCLAAHFGPDLDPPTQGLVEIVESAQVWLDLQTLWRVRARSD